MRGHDGPIEIDETSETVTKTFLYGNYQDAIRKAEREVDRALRFHEALVRVQGVSCPKIVGVELSPPPRVVMNRCRGEPLSQFLRRGRPDRASILDIADKIHDGLAIYVRLFDEPYYDLCLENLLYDAPTRNLTFIDFGIPERGTGMHADGALEASLGSLIGCACYDLARPSFLLSRKRAYLDLLKAVLATFEYKVSKRQIRAEADGVFFHMIRPGSNLRRHYYRKLGALMTNRRLDQLYLDSASSIFSRATRAEGAIAIPMSSESPGPWRVNRTG